MTRLQILESILSRLAPGKGHDYRQLVGIVEGRVEVLQGLDVLVTRKDLDEAAQHSLRVANLRTQPRVARVQVSENFTHIPTGRSNFARALREPA